MRIVFQAIMLVALALFPTKVSVAASLDETDAFLEVKGAHFLVKYLLPEEKGMADRILVEAERLYGRVARDIGYARYENYWTWEKRGKIVLFPDQYAFARFTGQPQWSKGYASRDSRLFQDHVVISYDGQLNFLEEVLPHEISHLMLWDYLGINSRRVPVWFEEGVAQLQEGQKRDIVKQAMRAVVETKTYLPFRELNRFTVTGLQDERIVSIFYAQSLSILVFLIEKYGQEAFYRLCKELKDGRAFEAALSRSYPGIFDSMSSLETRWIHYILD